MGVAVIIIQQIVVRVQGPSLDLFIHALDYMVFAIHIANCGINNKGPMHIKQLDMVKYSLKLIIKQEKLLPDTLKVIVKLSLGTAWVYYY